MRVLITGSREEDVEAEILVKSTLANHYATREITEIIVGDAKGVDAIATRWARGMGIPVRVFPADWQTHGKAAGPIRNQEMVDTNPDICYAFPRKGSKGTWDCVERCAEKRIKTRALPIS